MGDNMIRNHFSQSYCEVYKPLFPSACLHSSIVLPVYVSSVKIVSKYEIAKSCSAGLSILFLCCWKLTVSKGTGKHFHSGLIVHFFHSQLDLFVSFSKGVVFSQIHGNVLPGKGHVKGPSAATPEGKNDVIVLMGGCIAWKSQPLGNIHPVPRGHLVDVGCSYRIVVLRDRGYFLSAFGQEESLETGEDQEQNKQIFNHLINNKYASRIFYCSG